MAKRFTDTDKWKKRFIRKLPGKYKLLWIFICDDCDHAGVWHVDFDVAKIFTSPDISEEEAKRFFNDKIVSIDDGEKWFIPSFIEFQYGKLNPLNRAHNSVIERLNKYEIKGLVKGLVQAPSKGAKEQDKVQKKDMDKVQEKEKEIFKNVPIPKVLDNPDCIKALNYFFEYRAEVHFKPIQAIPQIELFLKKLKDLCYGDPQKAVKILNDSMTAGYPDIYEIKTSTGKKEDPKPTAKKKWGIKECPHCQKVDQYRVISESTKGIVALCQNCNKEFEVKNE